jgi:hypothetical protein
MSEYALVASQHTATTNRIHRCFPPQPSSQCPSSGRMLKLSFFSLMFTLHRPPSTCVSDVVGRVSDVPSSMKIRLRTVMASLPATALDHERGDVSQQLRARPGSAPTHTPRRRGSNRSSSSLNMRPHSQLDAGMESTSSASLLRLG